MPRCIQAECARNNKRERRLFHIDYRHCRSARQIYEMVRPGLEAGDYDSARRAAARYRQPCRNCGTTPRFVLTFPAPETDPSGFSLLEVKGTSTQPHQAPDGYIRCRPDVTPIPTLIELEQPVEYRETIGPNLLMATFVGAPALDLAYGQQNPDGTLQPTISCNVCTHAICERALELKALIAETPNPEQAAALLNEQKPLRMPGGHVVDFRLAMLTTISGTVSYQIVEVGPRWQNYVHSKCERPKLHNGIDRFDDFR